MNKQPLMHIVNKEIFSLEPSERSFVKSMNAELKWNYGSASTKEAPFPPLSSVYGEDKPPEKLAPP